MSFRQSYKLVTKQAIRWFPGHMGKGLRQMEQKLKLVDCIIEVHDARVPISGRNPQFQHSVGGIKPHILVLNKKDTCDMKQQKFIIDRCKLDGIDHVLFTNCKDQQCLGLKKLRPLTCELITKSDRFNRSNEKDFCAMIIGVPNVGKSSLLNVLRNRHLRKKGASAVGSLAGVTRSVLEKIKISDDPLIYMIDTPGILEPKIANDEMGMKLALVGCLPDHLVGQDLIADYLLYWLNTNQRFQYVELMGVEHPTDSISEVLIAAANKLGKRKKMKYYDGRLLDVPDLTLAAQYFIKAFRSGYFGNVNLDNNLIR